MASATLKNRGRDAFGTELSREETWGKVPALSSKAVTCAAIWRSISGAGHERGLILRLR